MRSFLIQPSSFTLLPNLPEQLLAKDKNADTKRDFRDRHKQTLFIDARKSGPSSTAAYCFLKVKQAEAQLESLTCQTNN